MKKIIIILMLMSGMYLINCTKERVTEPEVNLQENDIHCISTETEEQSLTIKKELKNWLEPIARYLTLNPQKLPDYKCKSILEKPAVLEDLDMENIFSSFSFLIFSE